MDDSKIAQSISPLTSIGTLNAQTVKIQHVGNGQGLFAKNVNFGSLKPAVKINETIYYGAEVSQSNPENSL